MMQRGMRLRFLANPSPNRVLTKVCSLMRASSIRGRSFTVSVPSEDTPRDGKVRKRVSKVERQVLVKEFINKYRSNNLGKFPIATLIQKEVGGSYYVVRRILQEVEYRYKLSPSNTENKGEHMATEGSKDSKQSMTSHITLDAQIHKDGQAKANNSMDTSNTSCMHSEVLEGLNVSVLCDTIDHVSDVNISKGMGKNLMDAEIHKDDQTIPINSMEKSDTFVVSEGPNISAACDKIKYVLGADISMSKADHKSSPDYSFPNKLKEVQEELHKDDQEITVNCMETSDTCSVVPEGLNVSAPCDKHALEIDISKSKVDHHLPPEHSFPEKLEENVDEETLHKRDFTGKQMAEKAEYKSSIWGNLRSVAEGIINIWRKR